MQLKQKWLAVAALTALQLGVASVEASVIYKYVDARGRVHYTDRKVTAKYKPIMENGQFLQAYLKERDKFPRQRTLVAKGRNRSQSYALNDAPVYASVSRKLLERREQFDPLITATAQRHGLPEELLHAVITAESAYNPNAVSHAGAAGLMQLMPGTASRFGVNNRMDPQQNVNGGARYLRKLLGMFDNNLPLAIAAYNAGEGAVMKHGNQVPPYRETQGYVRRVLSLYRQFVGI